MKFFQKDELKILWPFYLDALISPMLFFAPAFFIVYFRDMGFSLFQSGVLIAVAPLFALLFEIPTGAIADLYGRKFSALLGAFLEGLSLFLIFFLESYYAILVAFALFGFGSTFNSGAREAWTTDLIRNKKKNFLHGFFAKTHSLDSVGLVVSGLLGAFLVKLFGISIIWVVAGISYLITILILSFGKEIFVKSNIKIRDSFKSVNQQAIKSINYSRRHNVLFYFLIAGAIFVFAGNFNAGLSWIPFLQDLGLPDHAFGYMWSLMAIAGVIAPLASLKFMRKNKEKMFLVASILLLVIFSLFIVFVTGILVAFVFLFFIAFFANIKEPVERVFFHRSIPSKLRATIGSVEAMVLSAVAIIALPLAGLAVDFIGAKYTIFLSGILMVPAAIVYYRIKEKNI